MGGRCSLQEAWTKPSLSAASVFNLRFEANICVAHTCHCGKRDERDGLHGLSCTKSVCRFSHHALIYLIKQTLGTLDLPSKLELRVL